MTSGAEDHGPDPVVADPDEVDALVARALEEVRADLAARRASGALPRLPRDELVSHFAGVVEAVEAELLEAPPVDVDGLDAAAALHDRWLARRSLGARVARRLLRLVASLLAPVVSVGRSDWSTRTARALRQVAERQDAMARFLAGAHLDRLRTLEHRVAELEEELDRLRAGGG